MLFFYLSIIEDAKDRFAFEDLFMSIEQDVVNYANKLVHNKNDAEDIAQYLDLTVPEIISTFLRNKNNTDFSVWFQEKLMKQC